MLSITKLKRNIEPIAIIEEGMLESLKEGYIVIARDNKFFIYLKEEYKEQEKNEKEQDLKLP